MIRNQAVEKDQTSARNYLNVNVHSLSCLFVCVTRTDIMIFFSLLARGQTAIHLHQFKQLFLLKDTKLVFLSPNL